MKRSCSDTRKVLITGGTSGLGLEMVKYFLEKGYLVAATGRRNVNVPFYAERFILMIADFSSMKETSDAIKELCRIHKFDIIVNNAGILSPPDFMLTNDGFEYTIQVNFLSHLLLNEIVLRSTDPERPLLIASTVSPVYRIAENDLRIHIGKADYKPFKAYSKSKLYLALMCSYLPRKYPAYNLRCIGFDPGVFSSGIFRMQRKWFRSLYGVAAPFMRNPDKIAGAFGELTEREDLVSGAVYGSGKLKGSLPAADIMTESSFWQDCIKIIEPYLD